MQVGEWLNQGEGLVHSEDVPSHLNEEAAAVLNQKIDDHKAFFADLEHIREQGRTRLRCDSDLHSMYRFILV